MNTQNPKSRDRMKPVDGALLAEMEAELKEVNEAWVGLKAKLTAANYGGESFLVEGGGMGPEAIEKLSSWVSRTARAFAQRNKPKAIAAQKAYAKKQAAKKKRK